MRILTVRLPVILLFACLTGCGSDDPLRVASIQLGRSLNADNTVGQPANSFGPGDTIYVSILTTGSGSGTISVRWMYAGRVVGEPKKQVSYRDDAATEFQIQSGVGFPPGEYTVEAFLDGQSAGSKTFRVENKS